MTQRSVRLSQQYTLCSASSLSGISSSILSVKAVLWFTCASMWASACRPIFESGIIKRQGGRDATASRIHCPEALGRELANNNLLVDHDTDATGNCGVDGFLRSWRAMDSNVKHKHRSLRTCWQTQRNASRSWLEKHRREAAWGTLSVENFCLISSGKADFL